MTKLILKENPTLADFQEWIKIMRKERGFDDESIIEECLLLGEEVGELFKAIRKHHTKIVFDDETSQNTEVAHELADVFNMLLCVANSAGINLEDAFRNKENINKKRKWK